MYFVPWLLMVGRAGGKLSSISAAKGPLLTNLTAGGSAANAILLYEANISCSNGWRFGTRRSARALLANYRGNLIDVAELCRPSVAREYIWNGASVIPKENLMAAETVRRSVRFEIITDVKALLSLKPHWENLFRKSTDRNLSQSFEWCFNSWKIRSELQQQKLCCLVGWVDERVVIIWPLVCQRRALWSFARPLGTETTEYADVLVEDAPEADHWISLALKELRASCRSDVITLPIVRAGSRLHRVLFRERPISVEPFSVSSVSWDGFHEWDNYYRSLHREFRYSLRSRRRRLTEHGTVTFEAVAEHGQYSSILDWLFLHKTDWLERTNQSSPWQDTEIYKKQLMAAAAENSTAGRVIMFVLKLKDEIVAAALGRISQSSAETVVASFDQNFSKYGPGQLLYEDILKWAFERRLELDFRVGDEPYKRSWANRNSEAATFRFINSIWGVAFIAAYLCRSKFRSLRTRLVHESNPFK